MIQRLLWLTVFILAVGFTVNAQNSLTTQALSISPLCPGSTIDIPFTRTGTYNASNTFIVQLSDGSDYKNIETGAVSFNSSSNMYTATAKIPISTPAGTTYSLRITATNPAVIGTPSPTKLTIKTKPVVPTVDALILTCEQRTANDAFTQVDVKILSGAKAKLYNANLSLYSDQMFSSGSPTSIYFQITKGLIPDNGFQYPINEATYYVTQTVDGCESDKVATVVRMLYRPSGGPSPVNQFAAGFGRLTYCQGEKSYPLDLNGHKAPPENYKVSYLLTGGSNPSATTTPPTPDTSIPSDMTYMMSLVPIDATKGCSSAQRSETYLAVKVNARPGKPTVPSTPVSVCQFQPTSPLSASVTDASAALVWYGTSATGGTGSTVALQPPTASTGTFKYYVAQKLNDCESERAEITVEVKAASPPPITSAVTYCQGAQASPLSASAASGGVLTWYTVPSGGTGSSVAPTPPTNNAGVQTYYVTQTVATSCESQRIPLVVTINSIPAAPTVPAPTYVSCQNAQGEVLSATGQNLKWYEVPTGGTSAGSVTPNTSVVGTKLYYVSQTVNGCEGPRSTLTVTILSAPAAPTVTQSAYEFCQGVTNATISGSISAGNQTNWYIYGDEPGLISSYTSGNTAYAVVSTAQARTLTYALFQTATNGCKGPASQQITITIKPTPGAPIVQSIAICQNATAPVLQPVGQNLLWYSTNTGGTGSTVTPLVSTSQVGQTTYFVSQSLNGCEGPRAALTVAINAIPGPPSLATNGLAYCQNAMASSLTATGQGLNWYHESTGGQSLGDKPVPDTKEAGNFTYYVSQTINGCEGPRSSLTVKVSAAPNAPTVTSSASYCQKTAPVTLSAIGNSLRWYDSNGVSSTTAPTPSTDTPGTISYFVTQTVDNCESQRAEIKVTIKPIPTSPGTSPLIVCQNESAQALSASGQSLLWYSTETGGSGTATAPTLNTGQPGQINYYVSQTIDACEGPRATVVITVKPLPSAPVVSPKDICQFSKPESISATGIGLTWYSPDGSSGPNNPVPATDRGAVFSYTVTQTVDGCQGPKAVLTVSIQTTPTPTVNKSIVELCQGAISQPLEATGTNLRWTDPNGVVSTTAPVPPTLNTTTKADGDTYYVTQTGTNGCESPKVGIKVFIQTTPTVTILGTTSTNLGLEVPLKLLFTGIGPYQFRLSNGLTATATKDTIIMVLPERTTIYQVVEVANKCGVGSSVNGITVTVRIPTIQTLALTSTTVCAGANFLTSFQPSGEFNPGSVFKLQVAKVETDSTKAVFVDVPGSQPANGQLSGALPGNTAAGVYWVRVIATNPKIPIIGTVSPTRLVVRSLPSALLTGEQSIYEGQPTSLTTTFTGEGPWGFAYHDSTATTIGTPKTIQASVNPYVFEIRPSKTTAYYLTSVSNGCGTITRATNPVLVKVNLLLGIEDQTLLDALEVFPVPAMTTFTVNIRGLSPASAALLTVTDLSGRTMLYHETRRPLTILSMNQYPAGVYILRVQIGDRIASKRLVKL
jgi:hypothetical protein